MNGEYFSDRAKTRQKKTESWLNQSQGLMNGDSNPKRDSLEIILSVLFPATVSLDVAW